MRRAGFAVAVTLVLTLATITALVDSQVGSRVALTLLSKIVPVEFVNPRGDLLSGLDIERIRYQKDGVLVEIIEPHFRWRPASALLGTLHVQSLQASTLLVRLPAGQTLDDGPFNRWPSLRLPLRVELERMSLTHLVVVIGEQEPMYWSRLAGTFSLGTFHLRYQDLQLEHEQYAANITGASLIEFPYTTDARVQLRVGAEDAQGKNTAAFPYRARGVIRGGLQDLALRLSIQQPVQMQLEVDAELVDKDRNLLTAPPLQLLAQWQNQTLPAAWWVPNQPVPMTTGRLEANGTWRDFNARLQGNLQLENYPKTHVDIALQGTPQGATITQAQLTDAEVAVPLNFWQAFSVSTPALPFGIAVNFGGKLPVATKSIAPRRASAQVPVGPAQQLSLRGRVDWLPELRWDVALAGRELNGATFFPEFKSRLDVTLDSQGIWDYGTGHWQVAVENLDAKGELRDHALEARGAIQGGTGKWQSSGLNLVYGANTASVRGQISEKSQLRWNIKAPQLAQLWPNFSGSLVTQGNLQLNQREPKMVLALQADDFSFAKYKARQLRVSLRPTSGPAPSTAPVAASTGSAAPLDVTRDGAANTNPVDELRLDIAEALFDDAVLGAERYQLALVGRDLDFFGVPMTRVAINGDGGWGAQNLAGEFVGDSFGALQVATRGQIKQGVWRGALTALELRLPNVPRWWLVEGGGLQIDGRGVRWQGVCLTTRGQLLRAPVSSQTSVTTLTGDADGDHISSNQGRPDNTPSDARLCAEGVVDTAQGLALDLSLTKAPIRQLYAAFNPDVSLSGTLEGGGKLRSPWPISLNSLTGDLNLNTDQAQVNYRYLGGEVKEYRWQNTGLKARVNNGSLSADAQINWAGYGALTGKLEAKLADFSLVNGRINASFTDIAPLETFFTQVNDLAGTLNGEFRVQGSLLKPVINGSAELRGGSASLLALGITPTEIELDFRVSGNDQISLRGSAKSHQGRLDIDAQLQQLLGEQWQARGNIRGNDFRLLNTPQLRLHVSPNLFIGADRDAITIRGDTLVPHGRAKLKTLPESAVKVSPDVVIINASGLPQTQKVPWPVELNVRLDVGKDVKFTGFGLNSTLGGSVLLFKEKSWARPLLNGQVSVVKGTYKAYGQSLNVDVGRLIFQGSYENPGLDIRATREIPGDEATQVGLEISGTLQRPAAKVFSNPAMSESEAMMMLLTGRPIKDASSAEATLLLGALTSLGDGGEGFTQGLAGIFQVDEFGINANNGIEQSELWVGKYLTPKLLVRYVVGLFDQMVSIGVEYQINSRLRLEAKSGDEQSVDLIYKYER